MFHKNISFYHLKLGFALAVPALSKWKNIDCQLGHSFFYKLVFNNFYSRFRAGSREKKLCSFIL